MSTTANPEEIAHDFPRFFKVYKDGGIERYWNSDHVPPGIDPETGVQSKDVVISPETGVKARIFLPKISGPAQKLPFIVHYHGGGFCLSSPFSTAFKVFLSTLAIQANAIVISVDYRLAPEHLLPIAYDDSWAGLQWVAKHAKGNGPEPWINEHADLGRVILTGESAGGNIAHYVAVQAGATGLDEVKIRRLVIVDPYFGAKEPDKLYQYMCPTSPGPDADPKLNPAVDPNLKKLKVDKLLVCVAEKDFLKDRGVTYYETMSKSGLIGCVDLFETKGEDHCFHFFNPKSENIRPRIQKMVEFMRID